MKPLLIRVLSVILIAWVISMPDDAVSATPLLTQYRHTAWGQQEGSVHDANGVVQTADGYVWIATGDGLLRFDGVRFTRMTEWAGSPLAGREILSLFAANDGSLWAGSYGHVFRLRKDGFEDHLIAGRANSIAADPSGGVWVVQSRITTNQGGICHIDRAVVECQGVQGLDSGGSALDVDADGTVWAGGPYGICRRTTGQPPACWLHEFLGPNYGLVGVEAILRTRRGEQWVGIMKAAHPYGIGHMVDGRWVPYVTPQFDGSTVSVTSLFEDADECLWIGTFDQGIYRFDHGRVDHFDHADGLTDDSVNGMFQDRDGTVWVATASGLDAFRKLPVTVFSRREGLPANSVSSVLAARDGRVWVGNLPLTALRDDKPIAVPFARTFQDKHTTSLLEDAQGRVWVGLPDGVVVLDGQTVHEVKDRTGKAVGPISQMIDDSFGGVWALTVRPNRLLHIKDFWSEEVGTDPDLRSMALDARGGLLLAFRNGIIGEYDADRSGASAIPAVVDNHPLARTARSIWPVRKPPTPGSINVLNRIVSEADGTLFGMTSEGLLMRRGESSRILGIDNGLPCPSVNHAVRDADRALWLSTACGIVRIMATDLEQWFARPTSTIAYRLFDTSDGLRTGSSGFSPKSSLAPDGRLWFATDTVVQVIDPRNLAQQRQAAPPVKIEQIVADRVSHEHAGALQFPPRTRDIEIHYTALSFVLPAKVRFKYRLEGRDKDWTDAATRRVAYYTDLDPGLYRFQVIACNSDGVWNETGAAIGFEVKAAFYRTRCSPSCA